MVTPELIVVLLYVLLLLFFCAIAIVSLIVSLLLRGKSRFYAVNVLLTFASIVVVMLQAFPWIPAPKEMKSKIETKPADLLQVLSVSLVCARRFELSQEKVPALKFLSEINYPLASPMTTYKSSAKAIEKEMAIFPNPELLDAYLLINRKIELIRGGASDSDEKFAMTITPSETYAEAPTERPTEDVAKDVLPGWFREQQQYYIARGTSESDDEKKIVQAWDEDSNTFVWKIVTYTILTTLYCGLGAFVAIKNYQFFKRDPDSNTKSDTTTTGLIDPRMILSVILIAYYASGILAFANTLLTPFLPELLQKAETYCVGLGGMVVVALIAIHFLILKPANATFMQFFNLKTSFGELPLRVKQAFLGLATAQFVCLLAMLIQANIFRVVDSANPVALHLMKLAANPEPLSIILTLTAIVLFGPFLEEILFRGLIYKRLRQSFAVPIAASISAALFAAAHCDPAQFLGLFAVGLILSLSYERTKSLLTPVLMHATHNFLSLTLLLFIC